MDFNYIVVIATIPPRFKDIKTTIISWLEQTKPLKEIVIVVCKNYINYKSYNINILKDKISEILKIYPLACVKILTLDNDYGPNNKIVGALSYIHSKPINPKDNVIISDDDLIYDKDNIKNYHEKMIEFHNLLKMSKSKIDIVLTNFFSRDHHITHVQGADTYLLTSNFFQKETVNSYIEFLTGFFSRCPDGLYQDDYVISFRLFLLGFVVKYVGYKNDSYLENRNNFFDELHENPSVHKREKNVRKFIYKFLTDNKMVSCDFVIKNSVKVFGTLDNDSQLDVCKYFSDNGFNVILADGVDISIIEVELEKSTGKTVLFYIHDYYGEIALPNCIVFRTSFLLTQKKTNEFLLPISWIEPIEHPFEPLPKSDIPRVSFCGSTNTYDKREYWLSGLEDNNNLVKTDFIRRDGSKEEFIENLKSSEFAFCPRGAGNFSIRFYEALQSGRIPVLIVDKDTTWPLEHLIDWKTVTVTGETPKKLAKNIYYFWKTNDIIKIQKQCSEIFQKFFGAENISRNLYNQLDKTLLLENSK